MTEPLCVFDYPIARRTDQFDRLGECARKLVLLLETLEDWTGIYVPPFIWFTGLRMPVHDQPMEV